VSHSGREQWPVLGYEQLDSLSQIFAAAGVQLFMKDLHYFHFQKMQSPRRHLVDTAQSCAPG
jgi:hypothetical protein